MCTCVTWVQSGVSPVSSVPGANSGSRGKETGLEIPPLSKKKVPVNKLGAWGGGERGILRNSPRGISSVCCALSQWAQSMGGVLRAADQWGRERLGDRRECVIKAGSWFPSGTDLCCAHCSRTYRSRTQGRSLRFGLFGTLLQDLNFTAASPRCGYFLLSWILWIILPTSAWLWRKLLDLTAPRKSKFLLFDRRVTAHWGSTSVGPVTGSS